MNQKNRSIKKSRYPTNGFTTSKFSPKNNDINDKLMNESYLVDNVTVDDDMICQYSGLRSLKSYKKLDSNN